MPAERSPAAWRMLVVWCPEWPVDGDSVAIETFGPVVAAVQSFTPEVEVIGPGECLIATRGPSRYFGGDEQLARLVLVAVQNVLVAGTASGACEREVAVGVADGRFTARQAARQAARAGRPDRVVVVPPGESRAFLAPMPVTTLDRPELTDLLLRLGLVTLGQVADLPRGAALDRFGSVGVEVHRLARGLDPVSVPVVRPTGPAPELVAEAELEIPAVQVDTVLFVAAGLAEQFRQQLAARGMVVSVVRMEADTSDGERLSRCWRFDDPPSAAMMAERLRWQLDGWLSKRPAAGNAPVTRLRLVADEIGPGGRQLGFWGGDGGRSERAGRALARVQAVLGTEAVTRPVAASCGRGPTEQTRLVAWAGRSQAPASGPSVERPWPGRLPSPAPAVVFDEPVRAEVVGPLDEPVGVTGRGAPTTVPAHLSVAGACWTAITAWAGPWPVDERWWDTSGHRRRARWQVVTESGTAHLLALEQGRWWLEATY